MPMMQRQHLAPRKYSSMVIALFMDLRAPRIPGGSSVSPSAISKRWELVQHSEEGRRALLTDGAESELISQRQGRLRHAGSQA
jgi:hypothetical protein